MKVLHIFHHFWPCRGGIEKFIEELCMNLRAKGIESDVLCLNRCPGSGKRLPAVENYNGIKIFRMAYLDLRYYKVAVVPLAILRSYDLLHVHGIGYLADFLALTKPLHKKPMVLSTHGGVFHTTRLSAFKALYFNALCRLSMRAFSRVFADSGNDFEIFSKILPGEKLQLVELPVDVERFGSIRRVPVKNSLLFIGRIGRNKRVDLLVECLALLSKNRPDASLTVVGNDSQGLRAGIENLAKELGIEGKVNFTGEVSNEQLVELVSKSEFFVSASQFEGFGLSAIEAMAAGLIPVLNDIPSFNQFVQSGSSGLIVDFSRTEKAAKAMEELMGLPKKERAALSEGAKRSAGKYSWKNRIGRFISEYGEVVRR